MKRIELFDLLNIAYPCYAIGEHQGECTEPYVVLQFDTQLKSINNSRGGWQFVHLFCYAPLGDITVLDGMIPIIKEQVKDALEDTGEITPEVIEDVKKAYMRRLKYRIPKEVI